MLVSAFFRDDDASYLLRLDLDDPDPQFRPVELDPAGTFIGDITVTASGIVMIGSDTDGSRIYVEDPGGWPASIPTPGSQRSSATAERCTPTAGRHTNCCKSLDLGRTWQPVEQNDRAFSQTFVGPSGVGGTNTINSTEPWAVLDEEQPTVGDEPLDRSRPETYVSWSADGTTWHHETTTSAFGFPAFSYLAIGDGTVLAAATPLFGEPYVEGGTAAELFIAKVGDGSP